MPVTGTSPVMAIILTTTPAKNQENTPMINNLSLLAVVCSATFNILNNIAAKTAIIKNNPTNPKVSPMIAKTESLIDSGR